MHDKDFQRFDAEELNGLVTEILVFHGLPAEEAKITADHLVTANLRGVDTHGVIRLSGYIDRIKLGGNNPKPKIKTLTESTFCALMDGGNSLGQVGGQQAMVLAIEKARKHGIGLVTMRNSNHYGMAGYYTMLAARADMIGVSMTNVLACMAPTGGIAPRFGNNPISIGFPAGSEPPVVADFATSRSSWGKAMICAQKGEPLPEGCFLDSEGRPTIDPKVFLDGGTLIPIADYKGYALALSISLLTGLLSDGSFDTELPHLYKKLGEPGGNSFVMVAININSFVPIERFKQRMDTLVRRIRSTPKAEGIERIYLPGEIEHEREQDQQEHGIRLSPAMVGELKQLGREAKVDVSNYSFSK